MKSKIYAAIWAFLGLVFVVEAIGGSPALGSICAMFCGFMTARNIADIVQPNARGNRRDPAQRVSVRLTE